MERSPDTLHLPALAEHRAKAALRRAEAFCYAPESICGIPVRPLTPRTFSMLLATENRFVCGGAPQLEDVINYIWFHSSAYTHTGVAGWARRKRRVLRPLMLNITQSWRRLLLRRPNYEHIGATLAVAICGCRAKVNEAFADTTAAAGRPGAPIATLEAHFVHLMAASYGWLPERTRNTPLRQLFQLNRCIRQGNGEKVADPQEQEILAAHLRAMNEKAKTL